MPKKFKTTSYDDMPCDTMENIQKKQRNKAIAATKKKMKEVFAAIKLYNINSDELL